MKIAIFAAGGLGKVVCEALRLEGRHEIAGFFDDAEKKTFCGHPVLGKCDGFKDICGRLKIKGVYLGFGYNFLEHRLSYCQRILKEKTLSLVNAIHPMAIISPDAEIGKGVYIGPGVIINPGTKIGDNSVIWAGTIVEHDNIIGKNVFICPGVRTAGYVKIGDNSFIGMSANIAKAKIGENVTIGAASLVLDDVDSNKYVIGAPAKVLSAKKRLSYV